VDYFHQKVVVRIWFGMYIRVVWGFTITWLRINLLIPEFLGQADAELSNWLRPEYRRAGFNLFPPTASRIPDGQTR
jgi:hypothetical protein